jgi:FMN reductase
VSRTYSLVTLTAGLGTPSSTRMLADQLTSAARESLEQDGSAVRATTVELRELAHDITDGLVTPFPGQRLSTVIDQIREADAVIAVTPIFNVGPSGLFKMFIDALDKDIWRGKPVLLGATAGTARHSLTIDYAIRPMFAYLRAALVPTAVFAASSDFGASSASESDGDPLWERARRAGGELAAILHSGLAVAGGAGGTGTAGHDGAAGSEEPAAAHGTADSEASPATHGAAGSRTPERTEGGAGTERSASRDEEFDDFLPMDELLHRH